MAEIKRQGAGMKFFVVVEVSKWDGHGLGPDGSSDYGDELVITEKEGWEIAAECGLHNTVYDRQGRGATTYEGKVTKVLSRVATQEVPE